MRIIQPHVIGRCGRLHLRNAERMQKKALKTSRRFFSNMNRRPYINRAACELPILLHDNSRKRDRSSSVVHRRGFHLSQKQEVWPLVAGVTFAGLAFAAKRYMEKRYPPSQRSPNHVTTQNTSSKESSSDSRGSDDSSIFTRTKPRDVNCIVGIDLGLATSCVATLKKAERIPKVILTENGQYLESTAVSLMGGELTFGAVAQDRLFSHPKLTTIGTQHLLGRQFTDDVVKSLSEKSGAQVIEGENGMANIQLDEEVLSPAVIAEMLLDRMIRRTEDSLSSTVEHAILTVPPYFDEEQRKLMESIGHAAGVQVLGVIDEPIAQMCHMEQDLVRDVSANGRARGRSSSTNAVLVYDFGGFTLTTSLVHRMGKEFRLLKSETDFRISGNQVNLCLVDFIIEQFKNKEGIDLSNDSLATARLKEAAEKAKSELSWTLQTEVNLPFITSTMDGAKHLHLNLSRSKFEQLVYERIEQSMGAARGMADAAREEGLVDKIDAVLIAGGGGCMPLVGRLARQTFGNTVDIFPLTPCYHHDFVAKGACYYARKYLLE